MVSKICFVTCVTGNYEASLKNPALQTIACDWIAYVDLVSYTIKTPSGSPWILTDVTQYYKGFPNHSFENDDEKTFVNSPTRNTHTFNMAKIVKLNLHRLPELKKYDIVIWCDATLEITDAACAEKIDAILSENESPVVLFEHEFRHGRLRNEVDASVRDPRYGSTHHHGQSQPYQDVMMQYESYLQEGFVEGWLKEQTRPHLGVWITCFIGFRMTDPVITAFLDMWWLQNLRYTVQDQIGFVYAVWKTGLLPFTLPNTHVGHRQTFHIDGRGHSRTDLYVKHSHGR